jgi:hypothetical protein
LSSMAREAAGGPMRRSGVRPVIGGGGATLIQLQEGDGEDGSDWAALEPKGLLACWADMGEKAGQFGLLRGELGQNRRSNSKAWV